METELRTEGATLGRYRINVAQYLKMIDAGVFPDDVRVELLNGILVAKMTKHHPHNFAITGLCALLRAIVEPGRTVLQENALVLGRFCRPEPDLFVVKGTWRDYRHREPTPSDVALLIEVADSSYAKDRGIKWRGYASAMIPTYWIVNIAESRVEVYSDPDGSGRSAAYRRAALFGLNDEVPVLIEGGEVGRLAVRELFTAPAPEGGP